MSMETRLKSTLAELIKHGLLKPCLMFFSRNTEKIRITVCFLGNLNHVMYPLLGDCPARPHNVSAAASVERKYLRVNPMINR